MEPFLPIPAYIASLAPKNFDDARRLVALVPERANAIEWRLDLSESRISPRALLELDPRCAIVTYRTVGEGGKFGGSLEDYRRSVRSAYEAGAVVDVEIESGLLQDPEFVSERRRVIASRHGHSDLRSEEFEGFVRLGAAAIKIVESESRLAAGAFRCLRVLRQELAPKAPAAYFALGIRGIPSRVLARHFGSSLVYGSVDGATGGGQPSLRDLLDVYRIDRQERIDKIFGVYGGDVSQSLSPRIHNTLFARRGLPYLYIPVSASEGSAAHVFARDLAAIDGLNDGLAGLSITNPFKEVCVASAEPDAAVRAIGAANTLVRPASRPRIFSASNTDAAAIRELLEIFDAAGRRVVVLGNGGSARAALFAARQAGCPAILCGRDEERVKRVASTLGAETIALGDLSNVDAGVLVNATPLGAADGEPLPFPTKLLDRRPLVLDFVYRPRADTALAGEARARGCTVADGREILARQAVGQAKAFGVADARFEEIIDIARSA